MTSTSLTPSTGGYGRQAQAGGDGAGLEQQGEQEAEEKCEEYQPCQQAGLKGLQYSERYSHGTL